MYNPNQPPEYGADPGYCPPPPPASGFQPSPGYGPAPVVYQTVGNCPSCRQGVLQSEMTCLGICCAIFFFPIGLLCLFLIQDQRCPLCGFTA